jgi:hypothetical protein
MMFDMDKKLAPSDIQEQDQQPALRPGWVNSSQVATYIENQGDKVQKHIQEGQNSAQEGTFQNQIVKQYQRNGFVNQGQQDQEAQMPKQGITQTGQWLKQNLDNEDAVLTFLDDPSNQLEDQPTEVLMELAQKLKERRTQHFQEML